MSILLAILLWYIYLKPITMKKIFTLFLFIFVCASSKAQLSVNITTLSPIVCGVPDTLMANATGGVPPYTYLWNTNSTQQIITISATTTAIYTVTVTDASLNVASDTLTVFIPATNITGAITSSVGPTNGIVTLYKFSTLNAKLDSITSVSISPPNYVFNAIASGSYIVKATLNDTTVQQTYGSSSISWKNATHINHGCAANSTQNITVIPIINLGPGPGSLSGKITEGVGYGQRGGTFAPGNPIGGLSVKGGKNPGGNIVAQGRTNSSGEYTLTNFPVSLAGESYFILVDIPGLDTNNTYHRAITTGSVQFTSLNFIVDSAKVNPTQNVGVTEYKLFNGNMKMYPNPTSGLVTIELELLKPEPIEIKLNDLAGKEVKTILSSKQNFNTEFKIQADLKALSNGVYLMKLKIGDSEQTVKLILSN